MCSSLAPGSPAVRPPSPQRVTTRMCCSSQRPASPKTPPPTGHRAGSPPPAAIPNRSKQTLSRPVRMWPTPMPSMCWSKMPPPPSAMYSSRRWASSSTHVMANTTLHRRPPTPKTAFSTLMPRPANTSSGRFSRISMKSTTSRSLNRQPPSNSSGMRAASMARCSIPNPTANRSSPAQRFSPPAASATASSSRPTRQVRRVTGSRWRFSPARPSTTWSTSSSTRRPPTSRSRSF